MIKTKKRVLGILLAGVLGIGSLIGCQKTEKPVEQQQQAVEIPMVLTVNPSTGKKNEQALVKAFNKEYEGIWKITVEWKMETEEDYRQNLKRRNVTDTLPTIITDLRMLPSFYQRMIQEERLVELSQYLEQDEEWKQMIEPFVLESCKEEDGSMYLAPLSTAAFSCSGIFWNEELFQQAGIAEFPNTWEAFWECCEKLKAEGITPLGLHTEGTAWAPMLLATARLAETEEGLAFMKQCYPKSYQTKEGLLLAETLEQLFQYTTEDAIYADFDVAYSNFFSGKVAMIPNGYWMINQIPAEWESRTRFSAFPGNKLISSPETFGWSIVSNCDENIKKGALEFLKFRTKRNQKEKEHIFSEDRNRRIKAEQDYLNTYENSPCFVPNYQVKWNSILQEETLGEELPRLIKGKITSSEFTKKEDESIKRFEKEQ